MESPCSRALLAILSLASASAHAHPAVVEVWDRWEGSWVGPIADSSFRLDFWVDFEAPKAIGAARTVKAATTSDIRSHRGFYDGDGTFRARFMPDRAGQWSYTTRCATEPGLDGKTGTFIATAPSKHGPVKASGSKLVYADGAPHHSVGTTVYGIAGLDEARFNLTMQTLREYRFNKVRMMAFASGFAGDQQPYVGKRLDIFNVDFWRNLDHAVATLCDAGIQADVILFDLYAAPYPQGWACLGGYNKSAEFAITAYNSTNGPSPSRPAASMSRCGISSFVSCHIDTKFP